jgi:hypothetical protein
MSLRDVSLYTTVLLRLTMPEGGTAGDALPTELQALGFFLARDSKLFEHQLTVALRELGQEVPINRRLKSAVNTVLDNLQVGYGGIVGRVCCVPLCMRGS